MFLTWSIWHFSGKKIMNCISAYEGSTMLGFSVERIVRSFEINGSWSKIFLLNMSNIRFFWFSVIIEISESFNSNRFISIRAFNLARFASIWMWRLLKLKIMLHNCIFSFKIFSKFLIIRWWKWRKRRNCDFSIQKILVCWKIYKFLYHIIDNRIFLRGLAWFFWTRLVWSVFLNVFGSFVDGICWRMVEYT